MTKSVPDGFEGERTEREEARLYLQHKPKVELMWRIENCLRISQLRAFVGVMNELDCGDEKVYQACSERIGELERAKGV